MYWPVFAMICAVTNFREIKNQQLNFLCGDKTDLIERFMVKVWVAFFPNGIRAWGLNSCLS
jgi:hypothetical protein